MVFHLARVALVLSTLTAAGVASTPRVLLADDAHVSESPQAERSGAWTRLKALDAERPPRIVETPSRPSYATELAWAYVATPVLGFGIASLVGVVDPPLGFGGFALAMLLASTPVPLVYLLNDRPGRALGTFFLTPALFLGAVCVGTLISLVVIDATITRDTPDELEDGALAHGETAFALGVVAGVVAVATWAVFDVLKARRPTARSSRSRAFAQLKFGVAPRADGAAAVLVGRF